MHLKSRAKKKKKNTHKGGLCLLFILIYVFEIRSANNAADTHPNFLNVHRTFRIGFANRSFRISYGKRKKNTFVGVLFSFGDPYEIRTRVTAVKGRCLRPLDQRAEYGGCNWIRTNDTAGMNRML